LRTDLFDKHYTPNIIARKLISSVRHLKPTLIADLAVGKGDLLFEAERLWPNAKFLATDIDRVAIRRLRRMRKNWQLGCCDIRNPRSRANCTALRNAFGAASLILLNPPFSCRGGTRFPIETSNGSFFSSTAMSFLLTAIKYLENSGTIVAIMPNGCLYNQKDYQAWEYLRSKFTVSIIGKSYLKVFPNNAANTIIVRLSPYRKMAKRRNNCFIKRSKVNNKINVSIIRGCQPLYKVVNKTSGTILVHSVDLQNHHVYLNGRFGFNTNRVVEGPAILIPRVGKIKKEKIAIYYENDSIEISDCVIALKTSTIVNAKYLHKRLIENFNILNSHYVGTGAPFITISRLKKVLKAIGVLIENE